MNCSRCNAPLGGSYILAMDSDPGVRRTFCWPGTGCAEEFGSDAEHRVAASFQIAYDLSGDFRHLGRGPSLEELYGTSALRAIGRAA